MDGKQGGDMRWNSTENSHFSSACSFYSSLSAWQGELFNMPDASRMSTNQITHRIRLHSGRSRLAGETSSIIFPHAKHWHRISLLSKALQIDWRVALSCAFRICILLLLHGKNSQV